MRVAVVGHVEWVQFARVPEVPVAGAVVHAAGAFEEPAGGGAVAAVQLARLAGGATLFTALGEDELARRSAARLQELGVRVCAQTVGGLGTRRATTLVDDRGERTIVTFGERLDPGGEADGGWQELADCDAVYFTAGDLAALRLARAGARVLVASPRARHALGHGVPIDALVLSARDGLERELARRVGDEARLTALTEGAHGGSYRGRDGETGRWAPAPSPPSDGGGDSYGCGDSFAAGLAFALGAGMALADALALAARCGAACLAGRGPYESQLSAAQL